MAKQKIRTNLKTQNIKQTLNEKIIFKTSSQTNATLFNDINVTSIKTILSNQNFEQTMKLYRTMLKRDWQINGDLHERQIEIIGAKYKIEGEDKYIEFFESYLKSIDLVSLLADINSGIQYGYAIIDLTWDSKNINGTTYFLPIEFNFINQSFIKKDDKLGLFLEDSRMQKYYFNNMKYKFLFHTHKMSAGDILDYSILSKLIWIFTIKHFIVGQSMNYSELLGVPPIIVNSNSNDKDTILQMMDQVLELRSGSAGVFGKDDKVSLVEGKATSSMFMDFIKYCDNAISHIILGGSMSSSGSSSGSFARDKTHNGIKDSYHEADMRLISQTITNLFIKICDLNFNDLKEYPTFSLIYEPSNENETNTLSMALQRLQNMGIPISIKHTQQLFKLQTSIETDDIAKPLKIENEAKDSATKKENNFKFIEFNKQLRNTELDVQLNKLNTKQNEDEILKNIENIMQKVDSYQEALLIISQEYENLKLDTLESLMENYIFNATVSGNLNA